MSENHENENYQLRGGEEQEQSKARVPSDRANTGEVGHTGWSAQVGQDAVRAYPHKADIRNRYLSQITPLVQSVTDGELCIKLLMRLVTSS